MASPEATSPVRLLGRVAEEQTARPNGRGHIVLLIDEFAPVLGGGERVVLRTAHLLQQAGFRVSIVTFKVLCTAEVLRAAGCPVYLLPLDSAFSVRALRGAWRLGAFLRRQSAAVVLTYFESSNLFGGIVVKLLSRARLIWNRRDMGILRGRKHRVAYRWLRWLPDHVIAVSEQVRRHAVESDRTPKERVSVVYNGVDAGSAEPVRWPEVPTVVTVGNLRRVKGQDVLLDAAELVLHETLGVRFLLAGEPLEAGYVAALERRAATPPLAGTVTLLGGVKDPGPLLREASLFVLPSRSEGFSNAIIEAMIAGLPVVATTVGGNGEAVEDGVTGLLVPPENPEAMARAVARLLGDPEQARDMGRAGRARAEKLFSTEAMLRGLVDAFRMAKQRQRR